MLGEQPLEHHRGVFLEPLHLPHHDRPEDLIRRLLEQYVISGTEIILDDDLIEDATTATELAEAGTNVAFVSAELVVNPGTTEKITKQGGDYTLDFAITIKSQRAEAVATVKRGDKLVTRQRSTVFLNAGEGNIPLR